MRDRESHKLWLCQDSYIEKIAHQFHVDTEEKAPRVPLATNELQPCLNEATTSEIQLYQQKIGSIGYVAVVTRPDVAKAASKLSEFLLRPSEKHQQAALNVIHYLYATRHLAIQYSGNESALDVSVVDPTDHLVIASDASFADNSTDRKSSQGQIMMLFGGPVAWKSGKQDTVTTSSTEAELLALTHTVKETIAIARLFKGLNLSLDQPLTIQCDNTQTIRLVTSDLPRLKTQLKHVDIHDCWTRQAFQRGEFELQYTPTAEMIADGLTKALPGQKFEKFVQQLKLTDISSILETQIDSEEDE